jgi:hypothetical protein
MYHCHKLLDIIRSFIPNRNPVLPRGQLLDEYWTRISYVRKETL